MRTQADRIHFAFPLPVQPRFDQIRGEDVTLRQEFVIRFQFIQSFSQRTRGLLRLGQFFRTHFIDVAVERFARIEAALAAEGRRPEDSTLEEMDALWDAAKAAERG